MTCQKILSFLLFGIVAVGCTKTKKDQPAEKKAEQSDATETTATGVDYKNRAIAWNLVDEPKTLDAQKADDTIAMMILSHANEGLTRLDPNNKPRPAQAASWDIKSPTHYVFKIRKGAVWSDGKQVTAHDFVYAWRRGLDPNLASPYAFVLFPLLNAQEINSGKKPLTALGAKAVDDFTLDVRLAAPTGYFLRLLSFATFLPAREDFVKKHGEKYAADFDKMLSNGPFQITNWKHNASLTLTKSQTYWNKDKIWLNKIDMPYLIRDINSEFNMFKDGKYALVYTLTKDFLPEAQKHKMQIRKFNAGAVWYLQINTTRKVTGNKNFRKALQFAMDRNEYVKQVNGIPGARPSFGIIPDYMPGVAKSYGEEYSVAFKDNNLQVAKQYLDKAKKELGISKFPPINILASDTDSARRDMEYFQQFYKERLGLDFKLDFQTFKVRLERTDRKDFDIVYSGWGPDYLDAMTFADLFTSWNGNNNTGWKSDGYDKNIKIAMNSNDQKVRMDSMHAADKILVEDAPIVPIFQNYRIYVQDPRLVGVLRNPVGADPDFVYARISAPVASKK